MAVIAIDPVEIAWACGLFEGEGSIIFSKTNRVTLVIQMTDKDVLQEFSRIVGVGYFQGPYKPRNTKYKKIWKWVCTRSEDISELLKLWLPILGKRRKTKAKEALKRCKKSDAWKKRYMNGCLRGHKWTDKNTYLDKKRNIRRCRKCHNAREQKRNHAKKGR